MPENSVKKNVLIFHRRQEGRCLGCTLVLLLLLVTSLSVAYIFRHPLETWACKKTISYVERQLEQKKSLSASQTEELKKIFRELKQKEKWGPGEREKFWQAMMQLQKLLIQESLNQEDFKKIHHLLKGIAIQLEKERG